MKNKCVYMQQVHGNNVEIVGKDDIGKTIPNCDGLITNQKDVKLVVQTADCLPIMIKDTKNNTIGILHAGWRGLQKGIIKTAIDKMSLNFGTKSQNLIVGIGAHICQKHYEVKEDVSQYFTEIETKNNKTYLDLALVAKNQFIKLGVKSESIKISDTCTYEDKSLPSYRRGSSGRLLTSILM